MQKPPRNNAGETDFDTEGPMLFYSSSVTFLFCDWGYICEGVSLNRLALRDRGIKKEVRCFTADEVRRIGALRKSSKSSQ
jgi:hypothetical protein